MTGSGLPKNNLNDILTRRTISSSLSTPSISAPAPSKAKFKPSNASASSSLKKGSALSSFSTPGFGKAKATSSATPVSNASSSNRKASKDPIEIIDLSTDSISPGTKRTYDHSSNLAESQSSKRSKFDFSGDKENLSLSTSPSASAKDKGKEKSLLTKVKENLHLGSPRNGRDAQSKRKDKGKGKEKQEEDVMDIEDDDDDYLLKATAVPQVRSTNPFVAVDEDFPQFRSVSPVKKPGSTIKLDLKLLQRPISELREFLSFNRESLRKIKQLVLEWEPKHGIDQELVEIIQSQLEKRIKDIEAVIDSKEPTVGTTISPYFAFMESFSASTSVGASSSSVALSSVATPTSAEPDEDITLDDTEPIDIPDSDDALWGHFADVELPEDFEEKTLYESPSSSSPSDSEFSGHEYYPEVMDKLKKVFKLPSFRTNQLEAVIAALSGRDVFVLMPTGGGKSLCYQLPAVCEGGSTKGITVVISPLLSLMTNQVNSLREKNVDVVLWNSESTDVMEIIRKLRGPSKPSLLYVSPEKIKESGSLRSILTDLYAMGNLARFVIDEAHCISTWGQDFRDAYQCLDTLRVDYPAVPIMALTATANKVMVDDIKKRLKLRDCEFFTQSFNRQNLNYVILDKKKAIDDIYNFISSKHPDATGVIYCLGRDKCEKVAKQLRDKGLSAKHFHARMEAEEKNEVLRDWEEDRVKIVVATVAFGMGIDKPNVRFVIHHDLPKSLDGYYQETGRAGRDGLPADCILYYSYRDYKAIIKMINNPNTNNERLTPEGIARLETQARNVVEYCLNQSDCRRLQLLQFFNEKFDPRLCHRRCDNCSYAGAVSQQDLTKEARDVVSLVQYFQNRGEQITLDYCRSVYRGADTAAIRSKRHDKVAHYGGGKHLPNELAEQMFKRLCLLGALDEVSMPSSNGWHNYYLVLGPDADSFLKGKQKLELNFRPKTKAAATASKGASKPRKGWVAPKAK